MAWKLSDGYGLRTALRNIAAERARKACTVLSFKSTRNFPLTTLTIRQRTSSPKAVFLTPAWRRNGCIKRNTPRKTVIRLYLSIKLSSLANIRDTFQAGTERQILSK